MSENKDSTTDDLMTWSCPDPDCSFRTYGYGENEIHDLAEVHAASVHCGPEANDVVVKPGDSPTGDYDRMRPGVTAPYRATGLEDGDAQDMDATLYGTSDRGEVAVATIWSSGYPWDCTAGEFSTDDGKVRIEANVLGFRIASLLNAASPPPAEDQWFTRAANAAMHKLREMAHALGVPVDQPDHLLVLAVRRKVEKHVLLVERPDLRPEGRDAEEPEPDTHAGSRRWNPPDARPPAMKPRKPIVKR